MKELSDCRVLIVDDVKANVDILVQALSGEYKLSVALSGQQALEAVRRSPPDLILLDIVMPDIDGYEYNEARGIASRLLSRVHGGEA